jgi:ribosome-binding protein aMBF1 (putative translation factor)
MLEKIGENVRIARTIRGYSQEGLAAKIGKSQNWLQKVEKGEVDLTITCINELAKELELSPQQLIFTIPSQVFNNCHQSGNNNNYINNSDDLIKQMIEVLNMLKNKL